MDDFVIVPVSKQRILRRCDGCLELKVNGKFSIFQREMHARFGARVRTVLHTQLGHSLTDYKNEPMVLDVDKEFFEEHIFG